MGITENLKRIWLFSANNIKSSEFVSKQPTKSFRQKLGTCAIFKKLKKNLQLEWLVQEIAVWKVMCSFDFCLPNEKFLNWNWIFPTGCRLVNVWLEKLLRCHLKYWLREVAEKEEDSSMKISSFEKLFRRKRVKTIKVCKSYHLSISIVLHNFSKFLLEIKVSQSYDFVCNIGFVTLAKTNSSDPWR